MKIRMRYNHEQVRDVIELHGYHGYRWVANRDEERILYRSEYWEPVPIQTWMDVTGACEVVADRRSVLYHNGICISHQDSGLCDGYRMRKVTMETISEQNGDDHIFREVLIIEHLE